MALSWVPSLGYRARRVEVRFVAPLRRRFKPRSRHTAPRAQARLRAMAARECDFWGGDRGPAAHLVHPKNSRPCAPEAAPIATGPILLLGSGGLEIAVRNRTVVAKDGSNSNCCWAWNGDLPKHQLEGCAEYRFRTARFLVESRSGENQAAKRGATLDCDRPLASPVPVSVRGVYSLPLRFAAGGTHAISVQVFGGGLSVGSGNHTGR